MRIAHLIAECDGGIRHHVRDLARFVPADHTVVDASERGVQAAIRRLRDLNPDIVHCHGFRAGWIGRGAYRNLGARPRIAVTVHGLPGPGARLIAGLPVWRWVERWLDPVTDLVIAVSGFLADHLRMRMIRRAVVVVRNAVDTGLFCPGDRCTANQFTIGTAGRLAPEKGLDRLLHALAAGRPDWQLAIAGDGPERDRLTALAEHLSITPRVRWLGPIPRCRMPDFYRSLDLFCLLSRQEGLSLAAVEALASGLPVVTTDAGGLPEVVTPEVGVCVSHQGPGAIASAIGNLAADPERRRLMGQAARNRAVTVFSLPQWQKAMLRLYRALLGVIAVAVVSCLLYAAPVAASPRVTILIADGLQLSDMENLPLSGAAAGLLSTANIPRRSEAWLSMAAGGRVRPGPQDPLIGPPGAITPWGETYGSAYERRVGRIPDRAEAVSPDWPVVLAGRESPAEVGSLATTVVASGIPVIAVGPSHVQAPGSPAAVLAAANEVGVVHHAAAEGLLVANPAGPFGQVLDIPAVASAASVRPALILIDYGDLWRLEQERTYLTRDRFAFVRSYLIERLSQLLALLLEDMEPGDMIIVASLQTGPEAGLAPLLLFTGDTGIVSSATTRQAGIVSHVDLAPTVISQLGLEVPGSMLGRRITTKPREGDITTWLRSRHRVLAAADRARPLVVRGYITVIIVGLAVTAAVTCLYGRVRASQWLLLSLLSVPLVLLVLPAGSQPWVTAVWASVMAALAGGGAVLVSDARRLMGPFVICALTAAVIVGDQLTGGHLSVNSVLGYSPAAGARFYGIGNELAGVLLGSAVVGLGLVQELLPRFRIRPAVLAGGGIAASLAIVGNPAVGANFGGAVALCSAWLTLAIADRRRFLILVPVAAVVAGLLVVGLMAIDAARSPELQSHLGRMADRLLAGDGESLVAAVTRKASLNLRLIRYTVWSRVLLASVITLFVFSQRPLGAYARLVQHCPHLHRAVTAAMVGAGVALAVNDSGVVTAATTMIYVVMVLGHTMLARPAE